MKRILIVGENSYVGKSFKNYIGKYNEEYLVDTVSSRNYSWKTIDFTKYDVVFNVAGIAHISTKPSMEPLYYKINRDLVLEIALKAKNEGVKQFIHMSSMIVFGDMSYLGLEKKITLETQPIPINFYGKSKLEADHGLDQLRNENFKIAVIRPPLIYSENALGNFPRLVKIARILPIFPHIDNEQSMIYIDNICEFIRLVIENNDSGIFYPQNREYVNTTLMVKTIAEFSGKKIYTTKIFNPLLKLLSKKIRIINKAFGNLTYSKEMSDYLNYDYCVVDFKESLKRVCENYEKRRK
jgi:nucleoside-diphosphate-sugar epimerase